MAEDGRRGERIVAIDEVQVAVADPRSDDTHEHFAADGLVDVDLFDGERLVRTMEHGGFHTGLLCLASGFGAGRRDRDCAAARKVSRPPASGRVAGSSRWAMELSTRTRHGDG